MKLYFYLLTLCISSLGAYAQEVPTFTAERTLYYNSQTTTQPLNARYSNQAVAQLSSTFQEFSLVNLNSEELVTYVQEKGTARFVLQLDGILEVPIALTPNNLLSEGSTVYALGPNGRTPVSTPTQIVTYQGLVDAPGGGDVRLMLDGDQVQGFLTYNDEKIYLQNLNTILRGADAQELIVYNADDVIEDGDLTCLSLEEGKHERGLENQKAQATCNGEWELEIATFAAYSRYNDYNSVDGVNSEILGILNNVQSNYTQFDVKFKVVEQIVSTCSTCDPWENISSPSDLLYAFTDWGPGGFTKNHDEGILFYDGAGSGTVGVAWLGTICRNSRYAVVDKLNSAEKNRVLVAHEMGHNFSANHDASGSPYIMAPSVNNSNSWSSNSQNSITNHISTRTCLACLDSETPPEPPVDPPVSLRTPENPANTVNGLDYKYYEGTWNSLPDFASLTAVKSGTASGFDLSVRNQNDYFGAVFSGYVDVPTDGEYTFYTSSDDGSQLYIGSTLVVNNDGLHGIQERSGKIGLKAGKHTIRVSFFEKTGGESLSVQYASSTITKKTIPASALHKINTDVGGPVADNTLPWVETFELNDGTSEDDGTTGWSTEILTSYGGSASIQNGRLAISAVEAVWTSAKIDIADVSYFSMTYDYEGDNPGVMEDADYLKIEYRYDDGAWEVLDEETDGTSGVSTPYIGRGGNEVAAAQTLQLRITAKSTASNETWYVDNINIQCESCAAVASSATSPVSVETRVYPNPTEGSFTVAVNTFDEKIDIRLMDLQGKEIFRKTEVDAQKPLIVSESLQNGLYILEVRGSSFSDRIKLIKN